MTKKKEDELYDQLYGDIPDTQIDRIGYILGKKANNKHFNEMVQKEAKKIQRIKWTKVKFTLWKLVRPSARPRFNRQGGYVKTYVPHAEENGKWFEEYLKDNPLPIIETPCILNITVYEKTPSSFNIKNKVLSELGLLRPWKRTGDFDNYAKGIADMIQHGMLKDDCLVISSKQDLYYSIKPHVDIEISFMNKFPEY